MSVPPNFGGCYQSLPIECQAQGVPLAASVDPASRMHPNTLKGSLFRERYEEGSQRRKGKKIKGLVQDAKGQREAKRAEWAGAWEKGRGGRAGMPLLRAGALFTLCYCLHLPLAVQC